ncbi:efflux transporter outer membrane subunit [Xanthobacteraceae bacterium Astr-EGSB]|uniref:efflux transporter outer membrane subunit n=1 Tax=Astrobacterium formosum TaxID=3069710 RepID=UPI0027B28C41|nr:efflux transporter outer membrane subunit [Xanthobacteraceae bacterium Astr-EGSB]
MPIQIPFRCFSRLSVPLVLIGTLAGCMQHDLAGPSPVTSFATDRTFAATANAAWPSDAWWEGYRDQQLSRLIEEGLIGAADMRAAQARFAAAEAGVKGAFSALLPSLDGQAKVDRERQSYHYLIGEDFVPKGWNSAALMSAGFNWEIDFWGKNRAGLAAATSQSEAAAAEAAAARLFVSSAIASAYADLVALYAERDATVDAVKVRRQTLALIDERRGSGLENDGAVERARSAEAVSKAQLAEVDEMIGLTRNRIAALVGAGPDRGLALGRPRVAKARYAGLPASLPAELLGRRPDIVAARKRAESAAHRIDQAKAAFYPNINLAGVIGVQSLGTNLFRPGTQFGSIGPALALPIFEGGRLVAAQEGAEADYQLAVATYDGTLTQALREVADAIVSKRKLSTRLAETRKANTAAEEAWRVVSNRYRGGLATYLEVLGAEDSLIATRRAAAALEARTFILDIQLVRALGGGFRTAGKTS